jgi:hypothetical protein
MIKNAVLTVIAFVCAYQSTDLPAFCILIVMGLSDSKHVTDSLDVGGWRN